MASAAVTRERTSPGGHGSSRREGLPGLGWLRRSRGAPAQVQPSGNLADPGFDVASDDPLLAHLLEQAGPVDVAGLDIDSPALLRLRDAGVAVVVPLVASGELIGILSLGPRLSERGYSTDDRQLLGTLAGYAAPAMRLGQLVREQEAQVRRTARLDQELKVAQLIQQQFLPRSVPGLPAWQVSAFYRPARSVGGDFYDFIALPDGRVMVVVGDVTDKGVPAALVMASTHALLRSAAPRLLAPAAVLAQVNELLCDDIPENMFVTCLALALDPGGGRIEFANAGHDLPYLCTAGGVVELRATGMPLGLMRGMEYEQKSARVQPGDQLLLHSDGLAEAHNSHREMFGFPRVAELAGRDLPGTELIDACLTELASFTGPGYEQEDDITLVTLRRAGAPHQGGRRRDRQCQDVQRRQASTAPERVLARFSLPSLPGGERQAWARVAESVAGCGLSKPRLERLRTAVSEAVMNAAEHGNRNRQDRDVCVRVTQSGDRVMVAVSDYGGAPADAAAAEPDLGLKLAGQQSPRGWGLFLIRHMVDAMDVTSDGSRHTVLLTMRAADSPVPDGADGEGSGGKR